MSTLGCIHKLNSSVIWYFIYYLWKLTISILFVVAEDNQNYGCHIAWITITFSWFLIYCSICIFNFYYFNIYNNNKTITFFTDKVSPFFPGLLYNIPKIEIKLVFTQYWLFFVGFILLFITTILNFYNINMNKYISIWYTLCIIPILISIIMFNFRSYVNSPRTFFENLTSPLSFLLLWILICIILQNDFGIEIHSLLMTIPAILLSAPLEICVYFLPLVGAQIVGCIPFLLVFCMPGCVQLIGTITFLSLWIIYFSTTTSMTMATVMIPIWCVLVLPLCGAACCVLNAESYNEYIFDEKYGKEIIIGSIDDETINELNNELNKRTIKIKS